MEEKNSQIPLVKLGSQGFEVSRLGFGCGGLSGILNAPLSHEEGISLLKEAFNRGITLFDTANLYGEDNHNEIMIGKRMANLVSRESCEASLKRLGVDYIDLYYQHRVDTSVPIEDTVGELKKLVDEGKIRYIGLSEANVDTIRRAHAVHPITALQMEYSLWTREIEDEIIPLCRELGIGVVAYSPLGHGFFGGKAVVESLPNESILAMHPRFTGENLDKNRLLYMQLANQAAKHSCTAPQLPLAWLLHQGNDIIPIPGTTKLKNLESNIGALAVNLTQEDLKEISDVFPVDNVRGARELDMLSKFSWKFANTPPKQ